ncbi:MAG: M48 family metalloprotease [Candidatus Omnitrophica bacterium]|nr:M48 family metalloprotease [Candidatus Omnitrophota bacterium]
MKSFKINILSRYYPLKHKTAALAFGCYIAAFAIFLSGCSTLGIYNPATEKREFIFVSTPEEASMGRTIHQNILEKYKLSQDKEKQERLDKIGSRIVQISDRQDLAYKFYLLEDKELNAFTVPGGSVYFNTGLFDKLENEDQIAGVLAHEIGHSAARHTIKKFQAALGYNLVASLVLTHLGLEENSARLASMGADVIMGMVFNAYSRQDEYEADRLAVKYLYFSGYRPEAMAESFEILKKESKEQKGFLYFRTHPYIEDRIVAINQEVVKVRTKYDGPEAQNK